MADNINNKDKNESRKIALALISLVVVLLLGAAFMLPSLLEIIAVNFDPGLGLKSAAVISFFVTIVLLIIFAVASGDGLLGELQFILSGFFLFFVIIWLSLAWIF